MTVGIERNLLLASVVALFIAAATDFWLRRGGRSSVRPTSAMIAVATLLLAVAIAVRWSREQQGPFLTLYDVLLSNLCSLAAIFLVVYALSPPLRHTTVVVLPFFVVVGLWLLNVPAAAVPLPATFDNGWLWLHLASGKVFLGLCMVATAASTLLLLNHFSIRMEIHRVSIDPGQLDAVIWPVFSLAFVSHSFMLIAGSVWAHSAWGRYWAWDPLETSALVAWLAMGLLLHARLTYKHMPMPVAWISVIAIFVLAFLTFFGIPFVSIAPHKGVM